MTGPELDHELETIGRRLSPRVGGAHDAVVARATQKADARRPRTALPWPGRLGGAALTVAFTAGFAALLAVGVANRPQGSDPATSAHGPAVAMATGPAAPGASGSVGTALVAPVTAPPPAPSPKPPAVVAPPPPPVAVTTAVPRVSGGGAAVQQPEAAQAPAPSGVPGDPPWTAPQPSEAPGANQDPGDQGAPTPAPHATSGPASGYAPMRIVLTEQDSGRTITVHRGDVVEVELSAPANSMRWTEPQSSDQTVARRSSGAARSDGSAYAVFGAAQDGNAGIVASRMPACYFSTPRCLPAQRIDFQVTIVVTG